MTTRLSKLFGRDIYTADGSYKGKVFDVVINLEKGRLETITTEPLKASSKQEAKKIIQRKKHSVPECAAVKDIIVVAGKGAPAIEEQEEKPKPEPMHYRYRRR